MKTKECPSCAMNVDKSSEICPICQYEFPTQKQSYLWIAIALALLLLFLFLS